VVPEPVRGVPSDDRQPPSKMPIGPLITSHCAIALTSFSPLGATQAGDNMFGRNGAPMRIVEIREMAAPIMSSIRNAYIDFSKMTVSVVAVITDQVRDGHPIIGYGFNSNGRYAPSGLIRERFIPRLMGADPTTLVADDGSNLDPHKIWSVMMSGEKPDGHGERSVAVGTIDMAVWDAVARIEEKPLYRLLAERYRNGQADDRVFVYAAGGYYQPGKGLRALQDEMRGYLEMGYSVVKMKIGGDTLDEDLRRIEAVIAVTGSGSKLAVDANGRFDLATAISYAEALALYELFWYEEAGDPLDYALQAELANHYDRPMATGENLFSMQDARNLVRYGGMRPDRDWLQFDCALSYGLVEYLRTLEMLCEHGWGARRVIPHGGHQMSLNMAAGLGLGGNESYPGIFQPFGGFADGIAVEDGFVALPDIPGIGFEAKAELIALMRTLA
jgi:D(-)-tartrate dehydratase